MISKQGITTEVTPRFYVVNIKCLTSLSSGDSAALACEFVPLACSSALPAPSRTSTIFVAAQPCRTIFAVYISRFTLPLKAARNTTKHVFSNTAGEAKTRLTTVVAMVLDSLDILNVIRSAHWIDLAIFLIASFRTKGEIKFLSPIFFALSCFPACSANLYNPCCPRLIPAFGRTVFLLWVITRWHEQLTTRWTQFLGALPAAFIRAGHRTKHYISICTLFNLKSTSAARFHAPIIPYGRCMYYVR